MESEQLTPVDSIKDVVQSSMKVPEFNKHLKKDISAETFVEITIKMKTIVRKHLMIKIKQANCVRGEPYKHRLWNDTVHVSLSQTEASRAHKI